MVVVRRENASWRLLVLRAYRNWDFPKGMLEPDETPLEAAIRETAEEASITDLVFRWGEAFCETAPYGQGKVAHVMYRHNGHLLSLFMLPKSTRRAEVLEVFGHQCVIWSAHDRTFVLVSRETRAEVEKLAAFVHQSID